MNTTESIHLLKQRAARNTAPGSMCGDGTLLKGTSEVPLTIVGMDCRGNELISRPAAGLGPLLPVLGDLHASAYILDNAMLRTLSLPA